MDYSFLKLHTTRNESLALGDFKDSQISFYVPIQLSPNECYLQISNSSESFSTMNDYDVFVIDMNENKLKNITDNVFFSEFTDRNGINQVSWEIINIGQDFGGRKVQIYFKSNVSDSKYYTRPILITNNRLQDTIRFDYTSAISRSSVDYVNAPFVQSIRIKGYFNNIQNNSEAGEYYQISTRNTISTRLLIKMAAEYTFDNIDIFTFEGLVYMFDSSTIFVDGIRITNNPIIEQGERLGKSSSLNASFVAFRDKTDIYTPTFQIADANLQIISILPLGNYTSSTIELDAKVTFNNDIVINIGFVRVFNASDDSLVLTFTEADMQVLLGNQLYIEGFLIPMLPNGSYYVTMSAGLVTNTLFSTSFEGINDNSTWTFNLSAGDYAIEDYNSVDYFVTNPPEPNPIIDNLSLFYKFNETSGTTAIDASTFGNNGNIVNAVIDQVGLIDKCYSFNNAATNQYVEIPDADSLSFGAGAFSIELWVNPSANFGRILNKYNVTTGNLEYRLFLQSGVLQFFIYTDATNRIGIADNVMLSIGAWHQIVVTYDGSGTAEGLKMKVDNNVASFAPSMTGTYTGMPNTAQPVILGQQSDNLTGSNRYSGLIDILRVWKGYALSDAEITTLYNSGNGTEIL